MTTEQKKKEKIIITPKESLKDLTKATTIIETTYEKVLSIINKVKEFIKKTSSDSNNLIQDLEWVIKVITNKSLYTYELRQEKLSKQNAEYNKFINFVTKYNEEVIEMNKKHDIVSGILSIAKKGEILLKPSLCLKKILPAELQNMDENKVKEKKLRKNNFIYVFGNTILNLYHKEMERRKKSFENNNINKLNSNNSFDKEEEAKNIYTNKNSDNINNDINDNTINTINNINKDNNNNPIIQNEEIINHKIKHKTEKLRFRQKSENILEKENKIGIMNIKKYNLENKYNKNLINEQKFRQNNTTTDKKNISNIQRIRIAIDKDKIETKLKDKNSDNIISNQKIINNFTQTKYYKGTKLTKNEKITFNKIKNTMRNYYINFAFSESLGPIIKNNEWKGNYNNNKNLYVANYNNNYKLIDINNKNLSNHNEKGFTLNKNNEYSSFPHNNMSRINRRKDIIYKKKDNIFKNYKIVKSLKNNLIFESKDDIFDNIIYETNVNNTNNRNNSNINKKFHLSKRFQLTAENKKNTLSSNDNETYNIKTIIENKNETKNEKNETKNENSIQEINNKSNNDIANDIKKEPNNNRIPIISLIDKFFNDVKMITDKDFHIFKFKEKVGYKNVLPIMGYTILKTLGLIDSKIISIKKLDSFLTTVSDNYKITTLYHNSLHGADVTQSLCVYFLNSNAEEIAETTVLDLLGIIVSAMGHDLGHPGLNNNYLINSSSDLAITYNDASCLENFHTSYLFKILRKEENNILEKLSVQNYKTIRKRMISQILATDMANHAETISLIKSKIKAWKDEGLSRFDLLTGNEKTKFSEQQLLLNYLIHMADLGHNCKKFEISIIWVKILCEEFWKQGDKEKAKGLPISFMCDRNKIDVPGSQVGFLRGFILSSFDCLVSMFPRLKYTIQNAENNLKKWKKLQDEKRLLGWTPEKEKKIDEEKEEEKNNDDSDEIKEKEIKSN